MNSASRENCFSFWLRWWAVPETYPRRYPPDTRRLKIVVQLINEQYANELHMTDAAAACGCSPSHFMRWFKENDRAGALLNI